MVGSIMSKMKLLSPMPQEVNKEEKKNEISKSFAFVKK